MLNMNSKPLDELAARIGQMLESSPAKDIEKNIKSLLQSGLSRLDVVPRSEFDVQAQVLLRTRERLEAPERRLEELESRFAPPPVPMHGGAGTGEGLMGGPGPMGAPGGFGAAGMGGPGGGMGPGADGTGSGGMNPGPGGMSGGPGGMPGGGFDPNRPPGT